MVPHFITTQDGVYMRLPKKRMTFIKLEINQDIVATKHTQGESGWSMVGNKEGKDMGGGLSLDGPGLVREGCEEG